MVRLITLFAQLWILWIAPADCVIRRRRTTQNTKYPCLLGISMAITQCAPNRQANHVIRANHGYSLQQDIRLSSFCCTCIWNMEHVYWVKIKQMLNKIQTYLNIPLTWRGMIGAFRDSILYRHSFLSSPIKYHFFMCVSHRISFITKPPSNPFIWCR